MVRAVIFVLLEHLVVDLDRCMRYCASRGYDVVGVVRDDWSEAIRYLADGLAAVLVVADELHLDPTRSPRIEVVAHQPHPNDAKPRYSRRTRVLKRSAGA